MRRAAEESSAVTFAPRRPDAMAWAAGPAGRASPPGSRGEVPVKARALPSGGLGTAGLAGLGPATAGLPVTADSAWASSTTTAADGSPAAAGRTLLVPAVGSRADRPLKSWMLSPSATALADLPLVSV